MHLLLGINRSKIKNMNISSVIVEAAAKDHSESEYSAALAVNAIST